MRKEIAMDRQVKRFEKLMYVHLTYNFLKINQCTMYKFKCSIVAL